MRCAVARLLLGLIIGLILAQRITAAGDMPPPLSVGYGTGVHAYNAGDYQCSYEELTRVIEAGSNDPRVFYFRGLAAIKLGRTDEAEADFQQGGNLEADGGGGKSVSRALERVQGCDRLKLEHYRAQARISALQRNREAIRQRYSDIYEAEPDVLRRRRPEAVAPVEPLKASAAQRPAADAESEPEPPVDEAAAPEPGVEPGEEPAADPFGTETPFADEPAAEPKATEEDAAAGEETEAEPAASDTF